MIICMSLCRALVEPLGGLRVSAGTTPVHLGTQRERRLIPSGNLWAAEFLRNEPDYTEAGWIDAYAKAWSTCQPDQTPDKVMQAARNAFAREGHWNNRKVAAGCDATPLADPL